VVAAIIDSTQVQAKQGGGEMGPSPVDRGRPGSKHHLLVDQKGIPLAFALTGSNRNDVTQLIPLVDAVPAVRGMAGRPRRRPDCVIADRGYDHDKYWRMLRKRGSSRLSPAARPSTAPTWAANAGRRAHVGLAPQLQAPTRPL
jgi:hypothetical protein